MTKKWLIKNTNNKLVSKLATAAGISEVTAKILINRGITDAVDANKFLNPETAQEFYDPFLMEGMADAVDRIIVAIEGEENICVYGDYDVDGMSATALLTKFLRKIGGNVKPYIPNRADGYGINIPALEKIIDSGVTLLISVDCGISNAKEIAAVSDRLDFIITDHHLPALEEITDAIAILDPHLPNCDYPDKNLCGAGVAFKLCQAITQELREINFADYTEGIEIAALATVADLVPLIGENRKIVKLGLQKMRETNCIGLKALIKVAGLDGKKITASKVAFQIAPRLNSIGRLESASTGMKLLLTENEIKATEIAERLESMNTERKAIERQTFLQADDKVKLLRDEQGGNLWTLTIAGKDWNPGIIGLTASKLVEKYNLPTIVIAESENVSRGSCRSIPAIHMKNALDTMAELFENYGGHEQAAGFSLSNENIPEFCKRFDEYVKTTLTDADFTPVVEIDELINPSQIDLKIAEEFEKLEPCGIGNPEPVLACKNVNCDAIKIIGSDKSHLSFTIQGDNEIIRAVAFGAANFANIVANAPVDITYQIGIDTWQDSSYVKCFVSDIAPTAKDNVALTYELLTDIYKFIKSRQIKDFDICAITENFNDATGKDFSVNTVYNAVEVFRELGLMTVDEETQTFELPAVKKRDLKNSRTFRLYGK